MKTFFLKIGVGLTFFMVFGVFSCGPEMGGSGCGMGEDQKSNQGVCGPGTYWKVDERSRKSYCAPAAELCGPGTSYNSKTGKCVLSGGGGF